MRPGRLDAVDTRVDDADTERGESLRRVGVEAVHVVAEQRRLARDLLEQQGLVDASRRRPEHADAGAAHLPSVAVRTVQDAVTPLVAKAGDVGQLVHHARREDDPARAHGLAVGERHCEIARGAVDLVNTIVAELDAVADGLGAAARE